MSVANVKYFISINDLRLDGKLPSGDPLWRKFTDSFTNCELTQDEILEAIIQGQSYCVWLDGGRKKTNFTLAQHIAVDFDTDDYRSEIGHLMNNHFIRSYAGIVHTTPSHTAATPRSRVIFFLNNPVIEIEPYEKMLKFLIDVFGTDEACSDATRFFYGAKDCEIAFPAHELPISHLREFYKRYTAIHGAKQAIAPPSAQATSDEPGNKVLRLSDYRDRGTFTDESAADIIATFNKSNRVEQMLGKYGYLKINNRVWSRPGKKESAGVHIDHQANKTYNHSSNDPLFAGRNGGNQPSDPFDYYCQFEFAGDIRAAVQSLSSVERVA